MFFYFTFTFITLPLVFIHRALDITTQVSGHIAINVILSPVYAYIITIGSCHCSYYRSGWSQSPLAGYHYETMAQILKKYPRHSYTVMPYWLAKAGGKLGNIIRSGNPKARQKGGVPRNKAGKPPPTDSAKQNAQKHRSNDMPADPNTKAANTPTTPAETPTTPAETQDAPVETQDTPAETQDAPAETQDAPAETQNAPDGTPDAAAETPDAPVETSDTLDADTKGGP